MSGPRGSSDVEGKAGARLHVSVRKCVNTYGH